MAKDNRLIRTVLLLQNSGHPQSAKHAFLCTTAIAERNHEYNPMQRIMAAVAAADIQVIR